MASRFSDLKSSAGQCKIVSDVIHCLRGDFGFGNRLIVQFGGFLCFVSKSLVFNLHTRHCFALHPGRGGGGGGGGGGAECCVSPCEKRDCMWTSRRTSSDGRRDLFSMSVQQGLGLTCFVSQVQEPWERVLK